MAKNYDLNVVNNVKYILYLEYTLFMSRLKTLHIMTYFMLAVVTHLLYNITHMQCNIVTSLDQ